MRRVRYGLMLAMILMFMIAVSAGCARTAKPVTAKFPAEGEAAATVTPTDQAAGGELGAGLPAGFEEGDLAIAQSDRARDLLFTDAGEEIKSIYFAYDSAMLSNESKTTLEKVAQWLKENPGKSLRIEGNCDERGTTEYNLALGEKRALSARRYLISLGTDPDRIYTISFGEEKPAVEGHEEASWKFNRRDDFRISL